jgi:hypothetical protein
MRALFSLVFAFLLLAPTPSWCESAAQYIQASDGMARYGHAMQESRSFSETLQALAEWNSFVFSRSEWSLAPALVERLAAANWKARQAGPPTITAEELATAVTNLINSKLATMNRAQQEEMFLRVWSEATPKGDWSPASDYEHASISQNADGTSRVTVHPTAFLNTKATFTALAPGMMSDSMKFYPGEAVLVLYCEASGDKGFGGAWMAKTKKAIGDFTGLDMSNRYLFGENGYLARRPLNAFLTEEAMSRLFSQLGF